MTDRLDDETLAGRAANGERAAFESLVSRYGSKILAVIEKRTRDHHGALDLAQDAWVRVFRSLRGFETDRSFRPWLFSIVFNLLRDAERRHGRNLARMSTLEAHGFAGAPADPPAPSFYDPSGRVEELSAIDEALSGVPEPFRSAVHLVDVVGLSYAEAATSLACSIGTVKSRVNRGRLHFRDLYLKLSGEAPAPCPGRQGEEPV